MFPNNDKLQDAVARRLERAAREQAGATLNLPQPFAIQNVGLPLVRLGELLVNLGNISDVRHDEQKQFFDVYRPNGTFFVVNVREHPHAYAALLFLYEHANRIPEGEEQEHE